MANPNLLNITTVSGVTTNVGLGTTAFTNVLANSASSGKVYKINSIIVSHNEDRTDNVSVDVFVNRNAAGTASSTALIANLSVPSGSTQVVLDRNSPIYLMEDKSIVAAASTANFVDVTIAYEDIS